METTLNAATPSSVEFTTRRTFFKVKVNFSNKREQQAQISRSEVNAFTHHRGLRRRATVRHCSSDTYYRNDP